MLGSGWEKPELDTKKQYTEEQNVGPDPKMKV